jgi:hypothetical membrane protein
MLSTGVVSSLLYAALDLMAGLRYEGYSFYSQTISELAAIGAPQPLYLTPLFLTYTVLMVMFGAAVLLEGVRSSARVRNVGALLLLYMLVGSGTALFPVHVRGTAVLADELPHIVSGLAAIVVMLATMHLGSSALGPRFGTFSRAMIATLFTFSLLTVPFGFKLAANQPTPGMGATERIAYYSMLAWVAVLSVTLMRRTAAPMEPRS